MQKAKEFVADKVAHMKKPEANLTDVSVKGISRHGADLAGHLAIHNPYRYSRSIPICEISYTFKSADRVIVSGTMPDPGSIESKETTKMIIPLKVPYDFLMSLMRDVGRDWDIDYELLVGLIVDLPILGNFTLPLSKKGQLKLPTLSDLF